MRAKEFITEAFDQPYSFKWEKGEESMDALAAMQTASQVGKQDVAEDSLTEIDRMAGSEYRGGKPSLQVGRGDRQTKKLPGTNAFMYSTEPNWMEDGIIIKLWDPAGVSIKPVQEPDEDDDDFVLRYIDWERSQNSQTPGLLIGKLVLEDVPTFPLKGALQVDTITVDEDYRGQGVAKSLYGIALSILRRSLVAGRGQTPGGRRNWLSLASTPGVEVKGYLGLNEDRLKNADSDIDTIMGRLGGQYIGQSRPPGIRYFAFDVVNGSGELAPAVKTSLSQIYGHTMGNLGLYATWSGAVNENFADGRNPQDKGDSKRHGINTKASVSSLRKTAKQGGRKGQLAHWLANMKSGRAKKKKTNETVIGTLHFPKLIIAVDDHAIDRTRTRGISPATIDQSLRKLNGIADQLGQMESSNTVWVYDVSNNLALGLRRTSSRDMQFTLKTVVADRPYDGTTPIIELTS